MDNDKIRSTVYDFLGQRMDIQNINDETDLFSLDNFNSMMIVELIMFLENNLNIEIPEEFYEMGNYSTVVKIIETIGKIENPAVNETVADTSTVS